MLGHKGFRPSEHDQLVAERDVVLKAFRRPVELLRCGAAQPRRAQRGGLQQTVLHLYPERHLRDGVIVRGQIPLRALFLSVEQGVLYLHLHAREIL